MNTFSLLIALAACGGLVWAVLLPEHVRQPRLQQARRQSQQVQQRGLSVLCALGGALLGGRAAYVLAYGAYFAHAPQEILQTGGLSWSGALLGGGLAAWVYARLARFSFAHSADMLVPLLLLLALAAWFGCWLQGCMYGAAVSSWLGLPASDEWGRSPSRFPLQFLGAGLTLALFWALDGLVQRRRLPPGVHASLAVLGLSSILLLAAVLRADPPPALYGLRLDAWAALLLAAASLVALGRQTTDDRPQTTDGG